MKKTKSEHFSEPKRKFNQREEFHQVTDTQNPDKSSTQTRASKAAKTEIFLIRIFSLFLLFYFFPYIRYCWFDILFFLLVSLWD